MRKIIVIFSVFCLIGIILCISIYRYTYILKLKDVENIKQDFFDFVSNQRSMNLDYGAFKESYDYTRYIDIKTVDNLELDIDFVKHNFKEGYMNVRYSYEINKGEDFSIGAGGVESKWYIKKIEGRWIVYKIEEYP